MIRHLTLLAAAVALAAPSAHAAFIISPTAATASSTFSSSFSINNTITGAGLATPFVSGVTDFDSYIASNPIHTLVASGNEWFSATGVTRVQVTYDLGSVIGIDRLALWNEEFSGFGTGDISISDDGVGFTSLMTINPVDSPSGLNYGAQVFALGNLNTRFVRFDISGCPQPNGDALAVCGIGEVAFATATGGTVPTPASLSLVLLALAAGAAVTRANKR